MSAHKARRIIDQIRGRSYEETLMILELMPYRASYPILKLVYSAAANARHNKYLVSEFRNSMARIFSILLFITCVYYLGRMPSPILTKKLKGISEAAEVGESEEERNIEIETISEGGYNQEQEVSIEENPSSSLFSEERVDSSKIDETEKLRVTGKKK
ncbi:hypothetical protein GQ457_14G001260 [Hibiscus cannabinus]